MFIFIPFTFQVVVLIFIFQIVTLVSNMIFAFVITAEFFFVLLLLLTALHAVISRTRLSLHLFSQRSLFFANFHVKSLSLRDFNAVINGS